MTKDVLSTLNPRHKIEVCAGAMSAVSRDPSGLHQTVIRRLFEDGDLELWRSEIAAFYAATT